MTNKFPDATKMVLSPKAQAIRNAFFNSDDDFMNSIAAVILELADQVAPDEPSYMRDPIPDAFDRQESIRSEMLAIAAELRFESPTP